MTAAGGASVNAFDTISVARQQPASAKLRIALIAHDQKKHAMVTLAREFSGFLVQCELCATGTTGALLMAETGLSMECLLSGPLGGDLQIGARLSQGDIDAVVFLRDPMTSQPHEPDINALIRACDVHDVPCATNVSTARLVLDRLANLQALTLASLALPVGR